MAKPSFTKDLSLAGPDAWKNISFHIYRLCHLIYPGHVCAQERGSGLVAISTLSLHSVQTWASPMAKVWPRMCMLRKLHRKIPLLQNRTPMKFNCKRHSGLAASHPELIFFQTQNKGRRKKTSFQGLSSVRGKQAWLAVQNSREHA